MLYFGCAEDWIVRIEIGNNGTLITIPCPVPIPVPGRLLDVLGT
jgi:hypothetical protein